MYSSTLPSTSALDGGWVVNATPRPLYPPPPAGRTLYLLYRRLGGPQGRSGPVRKISPHTGIRSPDRPARSESLYQLSYRGPHRYEIQHEYVDSHTRISCLSATVSERGIVPRISQEHNGGSVCTDRGLKV